MTTEAEKQQAFERCEMLVQKEEYQMALELLKPMDCIIATWMKGKIHKALADKMANSFKFKHYSTEDDRKQHREILSVAYSYLYKTGCMLPKESLEIKARLNPNLWYDIGQMENELARTRPVVEQQDDPMEECISESEDFKMYEAHHVASMVDLIQYWTL